MGQKGQGRMRVATLNYSGIFVSPFQFYAMDNWQQLQRIGRIFEENLKADYSAIKNEIKAVEPGKAPEEDYYTRRRFEWRIDKIDKETKGKRMSPLYIRDASVIDLSDYHFTGIGRDNALLDELEFKEEWARQRDTLPAKFTEFEMQMCRRFDFECYQAIVMYLFSRPQHAHFFHWDRNPEQIIKFDDIVRGIRQLSPVGRAGAIEVYREFMAGYFKRIDSPYKIQMTVDCLFKKWDLDVVCLQEVNVKLRERLLEQDKYFVFAPVDQSETDQCVILLKKRLPLVPPYFATHYQAEAAAIAAVRDAAHRAFNDSDSLQREQQQLASVIKDHFNAPTAQRILKKMEGEVRAQTFQAYKEATLLEIFSELMNPMKGEFDAWVADYTKPFLAYGRKRAAEEPKKKDREVMEEYLNELEQKGLLFWTEAFILTTFGFSNRRLQQDQPPSKPFIFGSLHLSSKQPKNKLQVQLLGIFIYQLLVRDYKLVFAGDYNSHIVIGEKENVEGLFAFVKQAQGGNLAGLERVRAMQTSLHIFPKHPLILTTKKKRTILQVQAKKTNLLAEKCIDQIISNIPILHDHCYTGDVEGLGSGQNRNKDFIPHMNHPYDHFIVEAVLDLTDQQP